MQAKEGNETKVFVSLEAAVGMRENFLLITQFTRNFLDLNPNRRNDFLIDSHLNMKILKIIRGKSKIMPKSEAKNHTKKLFYIRNTFAKSLRKFYN